MLKRTPLPPRTAYLTRSPLRSSRARPTPVNRKRRETNFARAYHSRARVRFVKGLGCVFCTMVSPFFGLATAGHSDNAHTQTGGMGLKAHYTTIVPLCRTHHRMYDERRGPLATPEVRAAIAACAERVEALWLLQCPPGSP